MEDAQFPPVAGDATSAAARRSSLRLSDAEAVAATRLDMFGDNALKNALAAAPPNPAEAGASNGTAPEAPTDQPRHVADATVAGAAPATVEMAAIEGTPQPVEATPEPLPTDLTDPDAANDAADGATGNVTYAYSTDAANDAANAADVARDLQPVAAASRLQLGVPDPDRLSAAVFRAAAPTAHMEFSPVFSALDEAERHAGAQWNGEDRSAQPSHEAHGEHDAVAAESASIAAVPDDAETLAPAGAAVEAPAGPPVGEPEAAPPAQASQLHDFAPPFLDAPIGGEPFGSSSPPPFREDLAPPAPVFDAAAPAAPVLDAAAQIAAEANATAQALENLKLLLENNRPDLEPVLRPMVRPEPMVQRQPMVEPDEAFGVRAYSPPPRVEGLRIGPQTEAPSLAGTTAPLLPLAVPPPSERGSRKGLYLLGFLSGLGLSLMTGIVLYFVLYFVINTTG